MIRGMSTEILASLAICLLAGGSLWLARRTLRLPRLALAQLRLLRRVEGDGPLDEGAAVVRGRILAEEPLSTPHSEQPAVWYAQLLERFDRTSVTNIDGMSGRWVVEERREEAVPFSLEPVDSQRPPIAVDPEGAEVKLALSSPRAMEETTGLGEHLRLSEALLAPGDEVWAHGTVEQRGGFEPDALYRGSTVRPVLCAGRGGLTITPARSAWRRLWGYLLLGAAMATGAAVATAMAVHVTANSFPRIRVELPGAPGQVGPMPARYRGYWRCKPDSPAAGEARVEAWVLGLARQNRAEHQAMGALDSALWQRKLNGVRALSLSRSRRYLLFDVLTWQGQTCHRPAFWRSFCTHNRELCRR